MPAVAGIGKRLGQFTFGCGDGLPAAELADVRGADIEDQPDFRRG
jgi:hypothetical protein